MTLRKNGYRVEEPFVLDAAHFGVPQQRQRLFVVGTRGKRKFRHPVPLSSRVGAASVLSSRTPKAPNNETREHKAESVSRYMRLDYGQRDQLGRVDRLDPSLPSKNSNSRWHEWWRQITPSPGDSSHFKCAGMCSPPNISQRLCFYRTIRTAVHPSRKCRPARFGGKNGARHS